LKNLIDLELKNPILLCSWQGWPDAAESATKSIEEIISQLKIIYKYENETNINSFTSVY